MTTRWMAGLPEPHPMAGQRWEQDRCPDCGAPGLEVSRIRPFIIMACPVCEPEAFR